MPLRIFNSLTRQKEEFKPINSIVTMYVCGPTVYDLSHIGHARSAVAFDVVYRYLKYKGFEVQYVRNYTDIDDKIIKRANQDGVNWKEIAERYIKAFDEDMAALGVEIPTYRPRATEMIQEMIDIIQALIGKGFAYKLDGDVYYSVRKFKGYGKLSGKNIEELESGARVEVDERKEDPLDFALWKKSKPDEPWWNSPWGKGRPGWHIECSAMSQKFLGETIDIHGGGKDLIFPHHENEIAQSEAATGNQFVKFWIHNGFVNIDQEKMSKSLGNILSIKDALKRYSAEVIRLFLLSGQYRSPIDYSQESLRNAEAEMDRFYETIERIERDWPNLLRRTVDEKVKEEILKTFISAMDDDFNTAAAIGFVFQKVNEANRQMDRAKKIGEDEEFQDALQKIMSIFKEMSGILGVFNESSQDYFQQKKSRCRVPEDEIEKLIAQRTEARKNNDFKRADEIRNELEKNGIFLEDASKGTIWRIKG